MICDNISAEVNGHLCFAGQDTVALASQYGTPLYLMDENKIREKCRIYLDAFREYFPAGSKPLYASKACSFRQIYRIMKDMGMGIDVVSPGEIYTAGSAGFDLSEAYFHGNNKTDGDIAFAMDHGVGYFVADNLEEVYAIDRMAGERRKVQNVLLRITPGIDPHTYDAISTGKVDSKFGSPIETGQAAEITGKTLACKNIRLMGFHCHVGSQVFGGDVFERAAAVMLSFIKEMQDMYGYAAKQLNLGGGYGVRYIEEDPFLDIAERIKSVSSSIQDTCSKLGIECPAIMMEPGRSIVADSGMTLYTVVNVKKIPGYKNYVSVDGGMTDDPRFALYRSRYTVYAAGRMNEEKDLACSVVGRCCESGDILQENVTLPGTVRRGDVLAFATTGAYNYSMASNYNRIPRPPVILLCRETERVAVRRETFEDVCALDE